MTDNNISELVRRIYATMMSTDPDFPRASDAERREGVAYVAAAMLAVLPEAFNGSITLGPFITPDMAALLVHLEAVNKLLGLETFPVA